MENIIKNVFQTPFAQKTSKQFFSKKSFLLIFSFYDFMLLWVQPGNQKNLGHFLFRPQRPHFAHVSDLPFS